MSRHVIALIGLPGAGKSTVARYLLDHLALHEVNRDTIRHAMFPRCRYSDAENAAAVDAVHAAVAVNCAAGLDSLVDGMTFASAATRARLREAGERLGFAVIGVWLDLPVAVAQRRVRADVVAAVHPAADRDPALVADIARRFEAPIGEAARIDATDPLSSVCAAALEAIADATSACRPS